MNNTDAIRQKMSFPELPFYMTVNKVIEGEIIGIEVESQVHVERVVKLPTQYYSDFVQSRPNQFRLEVLHAVVRHYGLKLEPVRYS